MNIVAVRLRTLAAWVEAYQRDLPTGGLFVATTAPLTIGDDVVLELASPLLPNKLLIRGVVRSWQPARPRLRVRAGGVVAFAGDEQGKRTFIEQVLDGHHGDVPRRRQSRLPVSLPARYRRASLAVWTAAAITELSAGGALLATAEPLPLESEITVEITPPGAAVALAIAARVSYHGSAGSSGLRFVARDSDGARRLRELVRRVRDS